MGEFQGIIPLAIPHNFPAERNSGIIKENFLCGYYFPLFSLENHQGYFRMEVSRIFPWKFQSAIIGHTKGSSCEKISQWFLMSILWWIGRFTGLGKFPSHFNLEFWGKFRGCFCREISKRFSTAYNKWSMLIKPPVFHPANFIGDVTAADCV